MHTAPLLVICKAVVTVVQVRGVKSIKQNEKSSIWMVTAARRSTSGVAVGSWLVECTIYSASAYIPDRFFGLLPTTPPMMEETISTENNIRRMPRITLDRLYITHTRRIITTAFTVIICFSESESQQLTSGCIKEKKECPSIDHIHYLTWPNP